MTVFLRHRSAPRPVRPAQGPIPCDGLFRHGFTWRVVRWIPCGANVGLTWCQRWSDVAPEWVWRGASVGMTWRRASPCSIRPNMVCPIYFCMARPISPFYHSLVGLFVLGWSIIIHTLVVPFARVQYAHQPIKIMRHLCFLASKCVSRLTLFGPLVFTVPNLALLCFYTKWVSKLKSLQLQIHHKYIKEEQHHKAQ